MYKVLGEQSQDVELERTFIVFQDCMQGHKTPTQVVFTVATFEKYGVKWVWIKSHFKIHLPCDELDRKLLKMLTSELVLDNQILCSREMSHWDYSVEDGETRELNVGNVVEREE